MISEDLKFFFNVEAILAITPSSLTSVKCMLLESLIKEKISSHLMENNLIKDTEHGFMPKKSCATDLVQFMDVVIRAVEKGMTADFFYRTSTRFSSKDVIIVKKAKY